MLVTNRIRKYVMLFAGIVLLAAAAGYLALCAMAKPGHILPNTTVNGKQIGGMGLKEAKELLEEDIRLRTQDAVLAVSAEGKEYQIAVGGCLAFDTDGLPEEELLQEQEGFFSRGYGWLNAYFKGFRLEVAPRVDDWEGLRKEIKASGLLGVDTSVQTSYQVEDGKLAFTLGKAGHTVDAKRLEEEIASAIKSWDFQSVIVCPMALHNIDPVDLDQIYGTLYQEPVNAMLDPDNGYQIKASSLGLRFEQEAAQKALDEAEEGGKIEIELIRTEPEITTQKLEEALFRDQLATFTTKVTGTANRRSNVKLAAERCNGAILQKGDVFSFNDAVGEQTAETGFQKANATQGEKVIQAYGGGICQVSTTMFVAALYAGLNIPERWCHTYVSSYVEPGMDAAVAWGELDLKIASNMDYPVKLEVSCVGDDLTVTVLGTKLGESPIEIETEVLESTEDSLRVRTYRKIYSEGESHVAIERIAESEYINPSMRVD